MTSLHSTRLQSQIIVTTSSTLNSSLQSLRDHLHSPLPWAAMSRRTRAALKADAVLEDNTATEEATMKMSTRSQRSREPLRSLTPNSVESADADRPDQDMAGKKKGKKKGKGAKKNVKKGQGGTMVDDDEKAGNNQVGSREDEAEENFGESVASQQGPAQSDHDDPKGMLRARMVRFIEAGKSRLKRTGSIIFHPSRSSFEDQSDSSVVEYIPAEQPVSPTVKHGRSTRSKAAEPEPKLKESVEPAALASRSYANGVEAINQPTADAHTPSHSNTHQVASPRATLVKSPIEQVQAMDALQNELNEVIKKLPDLDWPDSPTAYQAPPPMASKAAGAKSTAAKTTAAKTTIVKPKPAAAAVSKPAVTRSPSVRTATTNKLIKTTQPSAVSRTTSTKSQLNPASKSTGAPTAQPQAKPKARPSSVMITSSSTGYDLTSKAPRPVSMTFPAPPPPARSSKPPTRPTFALPGETITARLKAAREERQRKEEEELKKRRAFKARPVPGTVREGPKAGMAPRENAASRARRSIMLEGGVDALKENRPAHASPAPLRRSATVTGATSNAAKRASLVVGRAKDDRDKRVGPAVAAGVARSPSLSVARRVPSNVSAASSAAPPNGVKVSTSDMAVQKQKAREIFNRDRVEKEARDRDRKDKEDAARKARAQAAERGRQASREWAEKQKRKVEEAAAAKKAAAGGEATVGVVA